MPFTTSGQETEQVYSYNPGARTGPFMSCTSVWWTRCQIMPQLCSQLDWGQGCSVTSNLKVHSGGTGHDLLHYCTFTVEAANDTQNVRIDRACGKDTAI